MLFYLSRCDFGVVQILHLAGNGFSGSIPNSFNLTNLYELSLSYNRLTGTIPRQLMKIPMARLDLASNRFSGTFDVGDSFNGTNEFKSEIDDRFMRLDDEEDDDDDDGAYQTTYSKLWLDANRLSGVLHFVSIMQVMKQIFLTSSISFAL